MMEKITKTRLFCWFMGFFGLLISLGFYTIPQEVKNCFYISDGVYLFFSIICFINGIIFILFSLFWNKLLKKEIDG